MNTEEIIESIIWDLWERPFADDREEDEVNIRKILEKYIK